MQLFRLPRHQSHRETFLQRIAILPRHIPLHKPLYRHLSRIHLQINLWLVPLVVVVHLCVLMLPRKKKKPRSTRAFSTNSLIRACIRVHTVIVLIVQPAKGRGLLVETEYPKAMGRMQILAGFPMQGTQTQTLTKPYMIFPKYCAIHRYNKRPLFFYNVKPHNPRTFSISPRMSSTCLGCKFWESFFTNSRNEALVRSIMSSLHSGETRRINL
mmetsp:Transcript_33323/g.53799  ORF Transcript_33323/g.53799 Transcript_33323/m.53799 type:complete len:213 (-) Transcript_33323:2844-3482(-)